MPIVFISHADEDDSFVTKLSSDLKDHDIETWVDHQSIPVTSSWIDEVGKALDACEILLFVVTEQGLASPGCTGEWSYALSARKTVVPIIRQSNLKLPWPMHGRQWANFTNNYKKSLVDLVDAINTSTKKEIKDKKERVTITLDLPEFNIEINDLILLLSELVKMPPEEIRILKVRSGSVIITLELPEEKAKLLIQLAKNESDLFKKFKLVNAILGEDNKIVSDHSSYLTLQDKLEKWLQQWYRTTRRVAQGIAYETNDLNDNRFTVVVSEDKGRVYLIAAYAPIELLQRTSNFREKLLETNFQNIGAGFSEYKDSIYIKTDFLITEDDHATEIRLWDATLSIKTLFNRLSNILKSLLEEE